VQQVW
jgi:hypothetical protein